MAAIANKLISQSSLGGKVFLACAIFVFPDFSLFKFQYFPISQPLNVVALAWSIVLGLLGKAFCCIFPLFFFLKKRKSWCYGSWFHRIHEIWQMDVSQVWAGEMASRVVFDWFETSLRKNNCC